VRRATTLVEVVRTTPKLLASRAVLAVLAVPALSPGHFFRAIDHR